MKINRLDAHDRFTHFTKQGFDIGECCQDLINKRPFGDHAFYIFAHARTAEDGVTKNLIWQPRLTKPKAQTNSMLFKGYPGSDIIKVIWMIPDQALWDTFKKGQITENETILRSIHDYQHGRKRLEAKEDDDLSDTQIDLIYRDISTQALIKQATLAACQVVSGSQE
jgi:hypothetical protein